MILTSKGGDFFLLTLKKKNYENKKVQKQNRKPVKIGYKLIAGYCIPVVLIILLGTISYQRSMKSIKGQYEQSVIDTVSAMSLNCKLLCENVQNKGAEFANGSSARVDDVGVILFAEDKVDDDLKERFFHR